MRRVKAFWKRHKAQLEGGLILPALVGFASWVWTTHAQEANHDRFITDASRELAQVEAQIRDLQARCPGR